MTAFLWFWFIASILKFLCYFAIGCVYAFGVRNPDPKELGSMIGGLVGGAAIAIWSGILLF